MRKKETNHQSKISNHHWTRPLPYKVDPTDSLVLILRDGTRIKQKEGLDVFLSKDKCAYSLTRYGLRRIRINYTRKRRYGKKEFPYNGCYYQLRIEESVDLSTRSGEEADAWRANKKKAEEMESQIADLRARLSNVKDAIAGAEKRYIAKHPSCKKTVKQTLVVL